MSTKGWRPYWTTPGLSELPLPRLDSRVSRDLHVKRDAYIGRDLYLTGNFNWTGLGAWQSYVPVLRGFTSPHGATPATGINQTVISARWRKFDTIVFFEVVMQLNSPSSANWNSNGYIDLPTKNNSEFTAMAKWYSTAGTTDEFHYPLWGYSKAGSTSIILVPLNNAPGSTPAVLSTMWISTTLPLWMTTQGVYEYAP